MYTVDLNSMMSDISVDTCVKAARKAYKNALSPISKYKIGAATIGYPSQKIYAGAFIENPTPNCTIYPECGAISAAIADGNQYIKALVLCADNNGNADFFAQPCLYTWQIIHSVVELCRKNIMIISVRPTGSEALILHSHENLEQVPKSFTDIPGIDLESWISQK